MVPLSIVNLFVFLAILRDSKWTFLPDMLF